MNYKNAPRGKKANKPWRVINLVLFFVLAVFLFKKWFDSTSYNAEAIVPLNIREIETEFDKRQITITKTVSEVVTTTTSVEILRPTPEIKKAVLPRNMCVSESCVVLSFCCSFIDEPRVT
eukprot:Awhi_evm1s7008